LKTDQAAIAEVMLKHGRDGFAAAWLRRKGLDWAADLINAELIAPHNVVTPSLWAAP
jgi:type IV secretion system protein TrbE